MPKARVVLCICTCNRPVMLGECLAPVTRQEIPGHWIFEILVVNNAPECDVSEIIAANQSRNDINIRLLDEPQRGIPFARNTACQASLELGADWIMMMDDDEIARPGWLMAYARAQENFRSEVFTGPVEYIFPEGYKEWLENKGKSLLETGNLVRRASTNNVIFSKYLLLPPLQMRFDNKMRLTGGEDSDFFMRYVHSGGRIIVVSDAVVSELVLDNRLRISWRLHRQYWSSSSRIYTHIKLFGFRKTLLMSLKEIPRRILHGIIRLAISPFLLLDSRNSSKKSFYHGLRHFSKAAGTLAGLLGNRPEPYKRIDGY